MLLRTMSYFLKLPLFTHGIWSRRPSTMSTYSVINIMIPNTDLYTYQIYTKLFHICLDIFNLRLYEYNIPSEKCWLYLISPNIFRPCSQHRSEAMHWSIFIRSSSNVTSFGYHETLTYYFSNIYQIKWSPNIYILEYDFQILSFLLDFWTFIHLISQVLFCHCNQCIVGDSLKIEIIYAIFWLKHIPTKKNAQLVRYFLPFHFLNPMASNFHILSTYMDIAVQSKYTSMYYIATMWQNTYLLYECAFCELVNNAYFTRVINGILRKICISCTCFLYAKFLVYNLCCRFFLCLYIAISVILECLETQYILFLSLIIHVLAKSIYWNVPGRDIYVKAITHAYDIVSRYTSSLANIYAQLESNWGNTSTFLFYKMDYTKV